MKHSLISEIVGNTMLIALIMLCITLMTTTPGGPTEKLGTILFIGMLLVALSAFNIMSLCVLNKDIEVVQEMYDNLLYKEGKKQNNV